MSYTIVQDKDDSLKISATVRSAEEWGQFFQALAKYRDKFETVKTKENAK